MLATGFLTFLWSLIVIFFMVIFFILLFHVIIDLFSRHDASGLKKKKYSGPLSFESFKPEHVAMDPYELATKVRQAVEPIIKSVS